MADSQSHKTWRATLNNPTELEISNLKLWDVRRCVCTREMGEEGTPHLQLYVTFTRSYRLSALKKLLSRAHWEPSITTDWNYELKGDSEVVHLVDNRKQGKRCDIELAYAAAEKKQTTKEYVVEQRPGLQAIKHYRAICDILDEPRAVAPVDVRWYYGPTGSGKTWSAHSEFPGLYTCLTYKWWDGYEAQETILIDDFRPVWCKWEELLRLTDRYPFRVEYKGGSREVKFKRVIITAPTTPEEMFAGYVAEDIGQLIRRIGTRREFAVRPVLPGDDGVGLHHP